jgi:hypothetical protein
MRPAKKAFLWGFFFWLGFGVLTWIVQVTREVGSITFNGEEVTGLAALAVMTGVGSLLGVFFGVVLAGVTALFSGRSK